MSAVSSSAFASRLYEEHCFIINTGVEFGYELDMVSIRAKPIRDLTVDALVCDYVQQTFPNG